ncbi:MAG TPA: extracellular solute-binding protein [Hyphomicrobiales bacterium]|nr:extracellular solute-binding protein [Hyphomicrobiales bacterium]
MIRECVVGLLLAAAPLVGAAAQSSPKEFAGQTLRVAIFGGTWQQWQQKTIEPLFTKATGAKVEYTPGAPAQFLAAMVAAKGRNVPFDLAPLGDDLLLEASRQGLLLNDYSKALMPNVDKLFDEIKPNQVHGPSDFVSLNGVLYDEEKFRSNGLPPPTNWEVLNNPKLAGHIAIPDITFVYRIIYANINYWKTGDRYNLDGTLEWLKNIKNPIVYNDFPTLQTRFNSGEIWAVLGSAGYILRFRKQGREMKFVIPQSRDEKGGVTFSSLNIIKGTTKARLAQIWINLAISDEVQTSMVKEIGFGASNRVVSDKLRNDPALKDLLIDNEEQLKIAAKTDWGKMTAVLPQWIDKWDRAVRR